MALPFELGYYQMTPALEWAHDAVLAAGPRASRCRCR